MTVVEPVSIRTKNPGAMWPGPVATRFGSKAFENLKDGNKAAIFDSFENGAAAQFYLWAKNYSGMTLADAIRKWSGGNSSKAYADFLAAHLPGLSMSTVITSQFLSGPQGLAFMKVQAQWEAGKPYPMTDAQWLTAQGLAFASSSVVKKTGGSVVVGGAAGVAAHESGLSPGWVVAAFVAGAAISFVVMHWSAIRDRISALLNKAPPAPPPPPTAPPGGA